MLLTTDQSVLPSPGVFVSVSDYQDPICSQQPNLQEISSDASCFSRSAVITDTDTTLRWAGKVSGQSSTSHASPSWWRCYHCREPGALDSLPWVQLYPHEQCRPICCTRNDWSVVEHSLFLAEARCFPCSSFYVKACLSWYNLMVS